MTQKTSIKIKKFWHAPLADDGGIGVDWVEIQQGQRESTVQFNGSDADVSNYRNVLGNTLQSAMTKGDKTMNFQLADLSAEVIAEFTGGTVTTTNEALTFYAPENENQVIEKSIRFLTDSNILVTIPRCSCDSFPSFNDDDLHYMQVNSVVLQPEKLGVTSYNIAELLEPEANDILTFSFEEETGAATIDNVGHTVAIEVASLTVVTALVPTITASLGASISPASKVVENYTSPVEYVITAADGTEQVWTVTVTLAT